MVNYAQPIKFQGFDVAESKFKNIVFTKSSNAIFINILCYRKKHSPQHEFIC